MKDLRKHNSSRWALAILIIGLCLWSPRYLLAGPVTSPGSAPYSRLSLYEGVIGILPGSSGEGVLEIGYRGEEIAGSSDLYIRPGSVTEPNGARLCTNCGTTTNDKANLLVPGQVCLYANGGPTADCRSAWPAAGVGGSSWELATESGIRYLQPNAANSTRAIHIGSVVDPVGGVGLDLQDGTSFVYGSALIQNTSSNPTARAVHVIGNANAGPTYVDGKIYINNQEVYTGNGNEGKYSGLDADSLEGNNVTLETAASCASGANSAVRVACLCITVTGNQKKCVEFYNSAN